MATLQQTSVEQYYIGWYGKSEDSRASFPLVNGSTSTLEHAHFPDPEGSSVGFNRPQSTFFKEIREVHSNGGAWKSYNGSATTWVSMMNFGVTALECGRTYWIILKPGTDSLDIPEFQFANQATDSYEYRIAEDCAPVEPEEKLWISFTGTEEYSDWYELETDEDDDFTKFKIATPNYGTSLQSWATNKTTNLLGINITASPDQPSNTSLTDDQKAKTFNSDLLKFGCDDVFNNNHGVNAEQVNMRIQAYDNQDGGSLKKYGSDDNTHGYLASGTPWEGSNMVYRTTTFNSLVVDNSGKNSIDIDYIYFIKETNESQKIKFSEVTPANATCGVWSG